MVILMTYFYRFVSFFALAAILLATSVPYQVVFATHALDNTLYFDLGGDGGWVPYRSGESRGQLGILAEVALLLESHSDIDFKSVNLPMKRAEKALKDGIVDFDFVCVEWFEKGNFGRQFIISDPLFEIKEYIVTLKGKAPLFPTLDAIHGKSIGTIAGYFYFDDATFKRVDFLNEDTLVNGLKQGQFDAIILEGETAKYWAKIHEVEIEFATLHSKGNLLMRFNKRNSGLLDNLNSGIKKMKQDGELQKILTKHGVDAKIF